MHYYIAEIFAYAFMSISGKKDYPGAALWRKDFVELNIKINGYTLILISDLAAITPENYDKIFGKILTKLYIKKKLRQMIPSKFQTYIDIWDPVAANHLPLDCNIDHQI